MQSLGSCEIYGHLLKIFEVVFHFSSLSISVQRSCYSILECTRHISICMKKNTHIMFLSIAVQNVLPCCIQILSKKPDDRQTNCRFWTIFGPSATTGMPQSSNGQMFCTKNQIFIPEQTNEFAFYTNHVLIQSAYDELYTLVLVVSGGVLVGQSFCSTHFLFLLNCIKSKIRVFFQRSTCRKCTGM